MSKNFNPLQLARVLVMDLASLRSQEAMEPSRPFPTENGGKELKLNVDKDASFDGGQRWGES